MADGFGYNDMMRMQSEAVQRVREMQRRAHNAVQKANAQRNGRAQEQLQRKGESPTHTAPPINHNAKSTALPLDYIEKQTFAHPDTKAEHKADRVTEESGQSAKEKFPDAPSTEAASDNLDRLLVVALILLLSHQQADQLLLMALGYLII